MGHTKGHFSQDEINTIYQHIRNADDKTKKTLYDKVILANIPLACKLAMRCRGIHIDDDDLVQTAYIGLIKAVYTYDPNRGRASSYFSRCIINELFMFLRKSKRRLKEVSIIQQDEYGQTFNLAEILKVNEDTSFNYDNVGLKDQIAKVLVDLPPNLQYILNAYYGLSGQQSIDHKDIAKQMGLSRSYISRQKTKALKLLRVSDKTKHLREYLEN